MTIDIDSFPIEVHGHQPGASYNGHYRDTVYHPLVASYSVAGDYDSMHEGQRLGNGFLHATLRQGQVHTAQGIRRFLQQVVAKAKRLGYVVDYRIDAGYTDGQTLDYLTDETLRFVGRIKANAVLQRLAAPFWRMLVDRLQRWTLPSRFGPLAGPHTRAWMPPPRHANLREVRRE